MSQTDQDTIVAIATAPGKGGVGVIRLSGKDAKQIGELLSNKSLLERQVSYAAFKDHDQQTIDTGLVLYFAGPKSFTGEEVVELQGHGGPIIQDLLLKQAIKLGARQARAGEFSERAFLNGKIDLSQAEAIADLIDSSTEQAAKGAVRSMQGEFSKKVNDLLKELIYLRMYVEAAIDFPDEEIDFLADTKIRDSIKTLQSSLAKTIRQAGQGSILRNGLKVVLAGKPNAGKSSLLNSLAGHDAAIVTDIAGTTRDTVTVTIDLDGLPLHIIDTAGLRDSDDTVERIGIERARQALNDADHVLLLKSVNDLEGDSLGVDLDKTTVIINKIDLVEESSLLKEPLALKEPSALKEPLALKESSALFISATRGDGLEQLKEHLKQLAGFANTDETLFTARRRHITALENARDAVARGLEQLTTHNAGELLADELLQAQNSLNEITGDFTADDLLGEIFSGFCIGK